jgi:DNA topoisomerase-1
LGKSLVIVESPAKARTIARFLGRNYVVKASMGHVRDLPKSQFGIDIENNFEPKYITIRGKGPVLKELRDAARKADRVLVATDPDREGEAIAWHLAHALDVQEDNCRIEFREITKDAVKQSIKNPRPISQDLVDAQQARRVLDRIVGYQLSPLLWAKIKPGLSAGRVQSVAVRIIVDRQREIDAFVPEEYWTITAQLLTAREEPFTAKLSRYQGKKIDLPNEESALKVKTDITGLPWVVKAVQRRERKRNPAPPFTTSTMQQEAARKLGFTAKKTMQVAQQLYEGLDVGDEGTVGLITYMRTDATRVSNEALSAVRKLIEGEYGKDYVPAKPRTFTAKKGAQEAHEAIRPTAVERTPAYVQKYLSRDQFRLYKLIWERFVASQMASAVLDVVAVDLAVGEYEFRANGSTIKFPGFLKLYEEGKDDGENGEQGMLPPMQEGEQASLVDLNLDQHFTQPPPRFTEAMLVKTLEELGIGRPSTYAPIIDTIVRRGYVRLEDKRFVPTELGYVVVDVLKEYFAKLLDTGFTAAMEEELDRIEEGEAVWHQVIKGFYSGFAADLEKAHHDLEKIEIQDQESDEVCEKCGRKMVYKMGRFGKFLACPGYPECKNTKPILNEVGVECVACKAAGRPGGQIVERRSRRGRLFYGCSNYPDCDYTSWYRPVNQQCPHCGSLLVVKKENTPPICANKECPGKV